MHVHFEQNTCTRTDSNFLSLSWMGKVPEDLPEEGSGWKLNRSQYYVEGWLASGNARGIVGVTFSTSHCHSYDAPPRSNFNLRGHRSEVVLLRWNEPYQKLATCDSRGVIFVWIKHEGRWSIELINDRNSQVTDFAWSHDGRMALICYRDGFILVGSVAGQRFWSSMLNLDNTTNVTCGVWSPDDQQVMFGTADGQIIVMSAAGALVTQVTVHEGFEITSMAWSCEKFNMEEVEAAKEGTEQGTKDDSTKSYILAVSFKYGDIFLMSGYDDVCPVMIYTTLTGVKIDWSNCGEYLAVGGFVRLPNLQCRNELHLYSKDGSLIRWIRVPSQGKPLTALTWGHNDKRLFLAAGCHLYVAWVSKQVVPLQFLCQRVIHQSVRAVRAVNKLPLPERLRCGVKALFSPTIKSYLPDPLRLRDFVCSPPPGGERLFCTMIRHGEENSGGHYTLYLEYLGGLVPLLKGKRASKLRPDFIIYDPKIKSAGKAEQSQAGGTIESDASSESDTDVYTDGCGSPRMQRRRKHKVFRAEKVDRSMTFRTLDELMFDDNLPETNRLVEVTSNIWGTRFQITGVASSLPACLGQVVYKTSLLHLQPRQMTITIMEISPARPVQSRDPNFTPAPHSTDDDDEFWGSEQDLAGEKKTVEVTVHDVPSDQSDDHGCKVEVAADGSRRSVSMDSPLTERSDALNGDLSSLSGKLCSSGTVRSRSLSPVWNSLTQTSSAIKHHGICSDTQQDTNNSTGWQGARPKSHSGKQNGKTGSPKSNNRGNISSCSPTMNEINNHKCAALSSGSNSHSSFQYANASGVMNHTSPTNRTKSSSSSPAVGYRRHETGFSMSSCVDKVGVGVETLIKGEELSPGYWFRDHTALSQNVSGSNSTSCGAVLVPLVDTIKGEGPRWADPASPSTKLLEEGSADVSHTPLENNLVADCSPTAPNCLDLHRRLYLAQQNIVDTGTPISPSNCPSCLPVQNPASSELGSSPLCWSFLPHSDHTAYNIHGNSGSPSCRLKDGSSIESNLSSGIKHSQSEASDTSDVCTSHSAKMLKNIYSGPSALTNGQALSCDRGCLPQQCKCTSEVNSGAPNQLRPQLSNDSNLPQQNMLESNTVLHTSVQNSLHQLSVLQDQSNQPLSADAEDMPLNQIQKEHEVKGHQQHKGGSAYQSHDLQSQLPSSSVHSTLPSSCVHFSLPKDLSSFDKLNLILSEDPSVQSSVHNFRSMPGFVMKNPDLKYDDDSSSSSTKDISDNSDEQLPAPVMCNEDLLCEHAHDIEIQQTSASLPSSPIRFGAKQSQNTHTLHEEILKGRCKHLSPLLGRKSRDILPPAADIFGVDDPRLTNFETLEVFQKSQMKQKVRHRMNETCSRHEKARTFTMHNKAPLWNETSQVYQLDFGGRVTQESAKNFQIELRGKQVMQFGRIENNAYTLDFQHPFTAVQAFAVALANVTQRLK